MHAAKQGHTSAIQTLLWEGNANLNLQDNVSHKNTSSWYNFLRSTEAHLAMSFPDEFLSWITTYDVANAQYLLQAAKFSAPFFAVTCKHNDMLDVFMRNDKIDLSITDLVGHY